MPTYPRYFKSRDDLSTYKVIEETIPETTATRIVTEMTIALDENDEPDYYGRVGLSTFTELELVSEMDEVDEEHWDLVMGDVDAVGRSGGRPLIHPH